VLLDDDRRLGRAFPFGHDWNECTPRRLKT